MSPGTILILYYATAIAIGSVLLALPVSSAGEPVSILNAVFTATSAQCVTGLTVIDTGSDLSTFGQLVVLTLIQLGGLGITTFSVYLFFFLRMGVGVRGRWIINETLLHSPVDSLKDLIRLIIFLALGIEAAGAVILSSVFVPQYGLLKGLYVSIFHSVSAFCNAGFSLFEDSLMGYRSNITVNLTIMILIITGGIGFLVIREVWYLAAGKKKGERIRMSVHSKVVLTTTLVLIFFGAALILFMENNGALEGMSGGEKVLGAFFQSVTARTAGFNTIEMNQLSISTLLMIIFLMFVGASPGSAGGGVKTTSLALFMAILYSRLRGSPHTNMFRRTISTETVTKTLALVMLAIMVVAASLFLLVFVQHPGASARQHDAVFLMYLFETVSAFGTVGLSMGTTHLLTGGGKVILIALMFVGRVGLLTVAFSIARRLKPQATRYAEENIMIG
ncbi:MAG: TrkH family potassium uptake protein [Pseudomonadota bacterium]